MLFLADKVATGQASSEYVSFCCQSFHPLFHTHHHLSLGQNIIGQIVSNVRSGLSIASHQDVKENKFLFIRKFLKELPPFEERFVTLNFFNSQ
jgi:hypothetical protein